MKHRATPRFWSCYRALPEGIRNAADRSYRLLNENPRHPSLRFKKIGDLWSVRVGLHYRALAIEDGEDFLWIWIGSHADYDDLVSRQS